MKSVNRYLGQLVKLKREKKGMTQLQLSQLLGYDTPQFVSMIERGIVKIPFDVVGQLIVFLDLPQRQVSKMIIDANTEKIKNEIEKGKKHAQGTL